MPTPFTKVQGAGNDFILFDLTAGPAGYDWSEAARALCRRHVGIGADGLLLVMPSEAADFRMRVINADGSEPEMCGNGLRCVIRYLHDRGMLAGSTVTVETLAGVLGAEVVSALDDPAPDNSASGLRPPDFRASSFRAPGFRAPGFRVRIAMGAPAVLGREALSLAASPPAAAPDVSLDVTLVSMGNPHCVAFVDDLAAFPFATWGPAVESHPRFPQRVNAEFAAVRDRHRIAAKVWERGAGPTLACGTGACAVAWAAAARGLAESPVTVELPGGDLVVDWQDAGAVHLTGPAELVFTGAVDLAPFRAGA